MTKEELEEAIKGWVEEYDKIAGTQTSESLCGFLASRIAELLPYEEDAPGVVRVYHDDKWVRAKIIGPRFGRLQVEFVDLNGIMLINANRDIHPEDMEYACKYLDDLGV